MEHVRNGRMLILNYANFYDNNNKNTKKPRMGSEKDVEILIDVFSLLEFKITVAEDLDSTQTFKKIQEFAESIKDTTDFIALSIMSHGENNSLMTSDSKIHNIYQDILPK